ncbi:MAG: MBL fold metallo-hydrolase [Butyrivibrio crossotus]|uniref:MBL fold metallo-hydrolase n=1 Tax=Eshraghiella crossota TaxID=45851 RepID=UPI001D2597CA|nr:MBL fold metallo-hydrolase [Butyrivibrio crossotus]
MRMMSIASGSSGNCIYIGTETTHILIDDGISRKRVIEGLTMLDIKAEDIDALLITHEHDDHTSGLGVLERHCPIPVYGTGMTLAAIENNSKLGKVPEGIFNPIHAGDSFMIGDVTIKSTSVSHDAADPVAYTFSSGKSKAGIITDLGVYTDEIVENFKNLDTVLIESNHDINMLMTGPYPYGLKQRILGGKGHLSNEDCGRLLNGILGGRTGSVFLGHLSKENNFPELAYETVRQEINLGESEFRAEDFDIKVANRSKPSDIAIF